MLLFNYNHSVIVLIAIGAIRVFTFIKILVLLQMFVMTKIKIADFDKCFLRINIIGKSMLSIFPISLWAVIKRSE